MKIACPVCGQHFDVEANMLDRYFRCVECQTLFLGLNAKAVKETRIIRKKANENSPDDLPEELSGDAEKTAVAEIAADALKPVTDAAEARLKELQNAPLSMVEDYLESEQEDAERSTSGFSGGIFVGESSRTVAVWSVCAVGVAVLILAIVALGKFGDIAENNSVNSELKKEYALKFEQLEKSVATVAAETASLRNVVDDLLRFRDHLSNKLGAVNVEKQLAAIDDKLKMIEERSADVEKVKDQLEKLENRVSGSGRRRR